jgi:hypothetical protein
VRHFVCWGATRPRAASSALAKNRDQLALVCFTGTSIERQRRLAASDSSVVPQGTTLGRIRTPEPMTRHIRRSRLRPLARDLGRVRFDALTHRNRTQGLDPIRGRFYACPRAEFDSLTVERLVISRAAWYFSVFDPGVELCAYCVTKLRNPSSNLSVFRPSWRARLWPVQRTRRRQCRRAPTVDRGQRWRLALAQRRDQLAVRADEVRGVAGFQSGVAAGA